MPPRKNSQKKRPANVEDYSSDEDDKINSSSSAKTNKKAPLRVPKKKLKKTTEERIKQVVGDDKEDQNNDMMMVDDHVDSRSKKAKRMDWEQGFFYLPKFDCYLPRHILHMILEYIPPFPYLLNIRCISQQWLDDFDTIVSQNVKELDLVKRNDIDYETVKYSYPWYDPSFDTRRNNNYIRLLAALFPNIEKLMVPAVGANVNVPNNILRLFEKLQNMEIFYVCPITFDQNRTGKIPLTYKQDITNIQHITDSEYLNSFCSGLVLVQDDGFSELRKVSNCLIDNNVITLFKYLVNEQHFSLKRLNILALPRILYSKAVIDFILEENVKQVERGYGVPLLHPSYRILHIDDADLIDYMSEKQFFKNLLPSEVIASYDWSFISKIIHQVTNPKIFKMLFEQSGFPLVFDEEINPLVWLISNNRSERVPKIIEFLCTFNPSILTLGDENGLVNGNEKNLNILELYLRPSEENIIDEDVISSLIKAGSSIKFVCPTTNDNLIHIFPYSPSLINALPVEYLQMKNNEGNNPLQHLVKHFKITHEYDRVRLFTAIEAFGKAYPKFGLSLNDVKFEKNQNLLHKFMDLPNISGIIMELIQLKVDPNAIDEDGNLPLFYFLNKNKSLYKSDTDFEALIDSISEEALTRQYNNKTLLTHVIESLDTEIVLDQFYYGSTFTSTDTLDLLENLLSRGCNLNKAISELSDIYYEKGDLDRNRSLFLMQLFNSISTPNLEKLRKIFKYFDNFEDLLTKACIVKGTAISPLFYLLSFWTNNTKARQTQIFSGDNPLIPAKLLDNIIDLPNKKIDALYYSIITNKFAFGRVDFLEGIFGIKQTDNGAYKSLAKGSAEIARCMASYRYEDEVYGNLNVVHLVLMIGDKYLLDQIHQIFSGSLFVYLVDLYEEPFKNGNSILDELAISGIFPTNEYNHFTKKWTSKHFRLAFEASQFRFCYIGIRNSYAHDFTKEEILQILIGLLFHSKLDQPRDQNGQNDLVALIQSHFADLTLEERFELFSRRFKVTLNNQVERGPILKGGYRNNWQQVLEYALFEFKTVSLLNLNTPKQKEEHHLSLLDMCYWKGFSFLLHYLLLEDRSGKKKKTILANSDLNEDLLTSWITTQCEHTGKTLIHFACQDSEDSRNYSNKRDLINDLVNYLFKFDREDAFNIQDNGLRTPAFYSLDSYFCTELIFSVSDLTLKNNKGETVQDLFDDEEKVSFAHFFEEEKKDEQETRPKRKTTNKKKQESDEEEKTPRKSTRRKK